MAAAVTAVAATAAGVVVVAARDMADAAMGTVAAAIQVAATGTVAVATVAAAMAMVVVVMADAAIQVAATGTAAVGLRWLRLRWLRLWRLWLQLRWLRQRRLRSVGLRLRRGGCNGYACSGGSCPVVTQPAGPSGPPAGPPGPPSETGPASPGNGSPPKSATVTSASPGMLSDARWRSPQQSPRFAGIEQGVGQSAAKAGQRSRDWSKGRPGGQDHRGLPLSDGPGSSVDGRKPEGTRHHERDRRAAATKIVGKRSLFPGDLTARVTIRREGEAPAEPVFQTHWLGRSLALPVFLIRDCRRES